jgi:hypothetical protein
MIFRVNINSHRLQEKKFKQLLLFAFHHVSKIDRNIEWTYQEKIYGNLV